MNPALIAQIAQWITLGISAASDIKKAVQVAVDFIGALFGSGLINAAQQSALMMHVDTTALAFLHGDTPPAWTVEPDPVTTPTP